jgi:putative endonuclease
MIMTAWFVYVLYSENRKRHYTGCTNDLERRLRQHNGELAGGAKYTRIGRPWVLKQTYGPFEGRGEAQRAEYQVKKMRKAFS